MVLAPQPEGGFVVTFPDVPEAITRGEDREEALLYAVDALKAALSFYIDDRRPLPIPSKPRRGQPVVRPSVLESVKLAIYEEMLAQGIKKAELARSSGLAHAAGRPLLDLNHASRMEHLESAARSLGREIRLLVV